ncbi:MAG: hypothetical protein ACFFD4_32345 [Candidatus Odinarchaeota archaeon]
MSCYQLPGIFRASPVFLLVMTGSSRVTGRLLTRPWDGSRPPTARVSGWGALRWSTQHVRPVFSRAHLRFS